MCLFSHNTVMYALSILSGVCYYIFRVLLTFVHALLTFVHALLAFVRTLLTFARVLLTGENVITHERIFAGFFSNIIKFSRQIRLPGFELSNSRISSSLVDWAT